MYDFASLNLIELRIDFDTFRIVTEESRKISFEYLRDLDGFFVFINGNALF